MDTLLQIGIPVVLIVGLVILIQNRRDGARVKALCGQSVFSRRRKHPPLNENLSVAMTGQLKDELVRISGNQQSKYVRASLRLALPVLKSRPSLVNILDED